MIPSPPLPKSEREGEEEGRGQWGIRLARQSVGVDSRDSVRPIGARFLPRSRGYISGCGGCQFSSLEPLPVFTSSQPPKSSSEFVISDLQRQTDSQDAPKAIRQHPPAPPPPASPGALLESPEVLGRREAAGRRRYADLPAQPAPQSAERREQVARQRCVLLPTVKIKIVRIFSAIFLFYFNFEVRKSGKVFSYLRLRFTARGITSKRLSQYPQGFLLLTRHVNRTLNSLFYHTLCKLQQQ